MERDARACHEGERHKAAMVMAESAGVHSHSQKGFELMTSFSAGSGLLLASAADSPPNVGVWSVTAGEEGRIRWLP